jgi:hypothetical protein
VSLLARVADDEVPFLFGLAEDLGDVPGAGQAHGGVVRRDGFDGQRARPVAQPQVNLLHPLIVSPSARLRPALHHQCRQDLQVGKQGLAVQQAREISRQAGLALLVGKARVGRAEQEIRDQPVKQPVAALDHDERAFLHVLCGDGEPDPQVLL